METKTYKLPAGRKKGTLGHSKEWYSELYEKHYHERITINKLAEEYNCTVQNISYLLKVSRNLKDNGDI